MILVTGAAGKTGRAVIGALRSTGQKVRGLVRRAEQEAELQAMGNCEAVVGDMSDPNTFARAASGVEAIYHICPNMHPEEPAIGDIALRAARAAGVQQFVYHSVLLPKIKEMPHHWNKHLVEESLAASGLTYTILQPAAYMQNVLGDWQQIVDEGVFCVPYDIESVSTMVDLQDVAEAATKVLTESGHEGAAYELCGSEALTQGEVADLLGEQLGRPVHAERIPISEWTEKARAAGFGPWAIETLVKMFEYYDQHGFRGDSQALTTLLGRPPTTFGQFVHRAFSS